jgi:hypothetical protein
VQLFEFLIDILRTHAQTLQRLAAFFGEEELLHMLEAAGDEPDENSCSIQADIQWFEAPSSKPAKAVGYSELQVAVSDLKLPAVFEFHLWAYPYYRCWIESALDLHLKIRGSDHSAGEILVDEAVNSAKLWVKKLPIRPELSPAAERAALVPWLRFRAEVLKKIGKRPIASL